MKIIEPIEANLKDFEYTYKKFIGPIDRPRVERYPMEGTNIHYLTFIRILIRQSKGLIHHFSYLHYFPIIVDSNYTF